MSNYSPSALLLVTGLLLGCGGETPTSTDLPESPLQSAKGGKGQGGGTSEPVLYNVTMSNVGPAGMGLLTDCDASALPTGEPAVIVAELRSEKRNGASLKAGGFQSQDLLYLDLIETDVNWTRRYDAGWGLEGTFEGCYGSTQYHPGTLFIDFGTKRNQSFVKFIWHFDYYIDPNVREHFSLLSEEIPFPAWDPAGVFGRVSGPLDLTYFLNDRNTGDRTDYVPLPGGEGLHFDFDLLVERVPR